jgi:lipoprotein Spr
MKAWIPAVLCSLLFITGTGIVSHDTALARSRGKTIRNVVHKKSQKHISNKKNKKNRRHRTRYNTVSREESKSTSSTLLRQYLPRYADFNKAKVGLDDAALPADFDISSPFAAAEYRKRMLSTVKEWVGTRYRYGGRGSRGIDCSGFTSMLISNALNVNFAGDSRWQAQQFRKIFSIDSLQFGDLLFFTRGSRRAHRIGHVGVYLGNGIFVHSGSRTGVTVAKLDGTYIDRFCWGGRINMKGGLSPEKTGVLTSH